MTSATALMTAGRSPLSVSVMHRKRFLVTELAFQTLALDSSRQQTEFVPAFAVEKSPLMKMVSYSGIFVSGSSPI